MIKKKQKQLQFYLMLAGSILILGTYFYYPYTIKPRLTKNNVIGQDSTPSKTMDSSSTFVNMQYSGMYLNEPFTIESNTAYILSKEPEMVYMQDMRVVLNLEDKRVVEITSDEGKYNKKTYDIFFKKNVVATDGNSEFFSDNLDLLATKNFARIYNNVNLNYDNGSLVADSVLYDFQTKYCTVSMFGEDVIKMKVKK